MKYKPQPIILSYQDKNLLSLSFDIFNYDFINLKLHLIPAYLNYYLYEKSYNLYFAKYLLNHAIHREFDNLPALKRRGFPLWAFFVQNG